MVASMMVLHNGLSWGIGPWGEYEVFDTRWEKLSCTHRATGASSPILCLGDGFSQTEDVKRELEWPYLDEFQRLSILWGAFIKWQGLLPTSAQEEYK